MWQAYSTTKKEYLRELEREKWFREQRNELWFLIADVILTLDDEPKAVFWCERIWRYYCRRFCRLKKCPWIEFLGQLDDGQAFGNYKMLKAKGYCLMVRDAARERIAAKEPKDRDIRKYA